MREPRASEGSTHLLFHVLRCSLWVALLIAALPWPPVAALVAAGVFFASFAFFHDCAHGALGIPKTANDLLLVVTSVPLMMSGHGQRQLHLRHHARPLADDDLEGEGALTSLWRAALTAPLASVHMRVAAFGAVNDRVRPWVAVENVVNMVVAVLVVLWGSEGIQAAFAMAVLLQLTMNAWASHVPHRAPAWLLGIASHFAWTGSPVVLSLVFHMEHHAHPRVPCALLKPDLPLTSPLLTKADDVALQWPQLKVESRPRPRTRLIGLA